MYQIMRKKDEIIQLQLQCKFVFLPIGFSMTAASTHVHVAFLLVLQCLTISLATQDDLVINTREGKVQGKLLSVAGAEVRAFLGIPYGKPPLGQLRFRAPEPAQKWDGVKDATKYPNSCYQMIDQVYPGTTQVYTQTDFTQMLCQTTSTHY